MEEQAGEVRQIKVSASDVGSIELARVKDVFDRGYLGMGAEVQLFEAELSSFFGRQAVCVSTGTSALQLALQACGVGQGDEVLVPSLTYVAAFQAISATGATPVAVDVSEASLSMDAHDAELRITGRTKAIMPVYYGGGITGLAAIYDLARRNSLRVIEDAAHAFGSLVDGVLVGSTGDIACFSFDPIKNITAGEGGCVVSNDADLLGKVRDFRVLGVRGDSEARLREQRLYEFDVTDQGWRYHMSNICAAIGIAQLGRFEEFSSKRRRLAQIYQRYFESDERLQTLPFDYGDFGIVPHIYVLRFRDRGLRDAVRASLKSQLNVDTAIHWFPNHLLTRFRQSDTGYPVTEHSASRMITLPLHTKLTEGEVIEICEHVIDAVSQETERHG